MEQNKQIKETCYSMLYSVMEWNFILLEILLHSRELMTKHGYSIKNNNTLRAFFLTIANMFREFPLNPDSCLEFPFIPSQHKNAQHTIYLYFHYVCLIQNS